MIVQAPRPGLLTADMLRELGRVAAGHPAGAADRHVARYRLAHRGLLRAATRARWDGLEIPAGWALTPAGCIELSAWEARARDARADTPDEVACGRCSPSPRTPGHDTQGDSP